MKSILKVDTYPNGVMADVMKILKVHTNKSEMLKPARNRALKKSNVDEVYKNCLTSIVPCGTHQDLGCWLVVFAQNTTKVMNIHIIQPSRNLNPRGGRSH